MERSYTHLEYLQVLAILKQIRKNSMAGPGKSSVYFLEIETFEDENTQCFNAIGDLFVPESFSDPQTFALITAKVYANSETPLFMFFMGQKYSEIIAFDDLCEIDKENFSAVLPFEVPKQRDLESVLSAFIFKINYILKNKLELYWGKH